MVRMAEDTKGKAVMQQKFTVDEKTRARLGRVAVLMGGFSSEREVSLSSGSEVLKALRDAGVDAVGIDPAESSLSDLAAGHFDRAFIALHGKFGEDGTVQGALEYLRLPYTGPGVRSSAISMDKSVTCAIWRENGLPVARGMLVHDAEQAHAVYEALGGSVVVKPAREGSSIGVVKLRDADERTLHEAIAVSLKYGPVLVEERFFGREFTVALIEGKALPIIEIKAPEGDYDYTNKYTGDAVKYDCPAVLPERVTQAIQSACEKAFAAVGARGWGRIDVMGREDGSFILLEINTSPGMTPHSLVPLAARATGMSFPELCVHVALSARLDS
jgi:D-alanine-D-alanine ligase